MGVGATILMGMVGSLVGGFLGYILFRKDSSHGAFQASGIIGSVIGSIIVLLVLRSMNGRTNHRSHIS